MSDNYLPARIVIANANLRHLGDDIARVAADADRLAEAGDVVALGGGLERLRGLLQQFRDLERHIEDHVAKLMDSKELHEEGLHLERRQSSNRKAWETEDLLRHLVGDVLVNPETGENVYRTLLDCLPLTRSLGWRVTGLRQHGIDPADWCEETPGRTSVRVWREDGS